MRITKFAIGPRNSGFRRSALHPSLRVSAILPTRSGESSASNADAATGSAQRTSTAAEECRRGRRYFFQAHNRPPERCLRRQRPATTRAASPRADGRPVVTATRAQRERARRWRQHYCALRPFRSVRDLNHLGASPNSPISHKTKPPIAKMAISPAMRSRRTTHVD
jgi:hypothetical protein